MLLLIKHNVQVTNITTTTTTITTTATTTTTPTTTTTTTTNTTTTTVAVGLPYFSSDTLHNNYRVIDFSLSESLVTSSIIMFLRR